MVDYFGSINGVILNASALCLNSTLNQTEKEINLMSSVNINGTFLVGQKAEILEDTLGEFLHSVTSRLDNVKEDFLRLAAVLKLNDLILAPLFLT